MPSLLGHIARLHCKGCLYRGGVGHCATAGGYAFSRSPGDGTLGWVWLVRRASWGGVTLQPVGTSTFYEVNFFAEIQGSLNFFLKPGTAEGRPPHVSDEFLSRPIANS